MKRILWIVPLLLVASSLSAQPAGVSVSLTATPNATESVVGSAIALTATVTTPGPAVSLPGAPSYDRNRLRYTFKAERTWPCAASTTLAENVNAVGGTSTVTKATHVANYVWTPPAANAGEYTFSVDVTYSVPIRLAPTTEIGPRPQFMGTATLNYKVKPAPGWGLNMKTDFSPPSPAVAPVSLTLNLSLYYPPEFTWYRWTYICQGCSPGTQTKDHQPPYTSFQLQIPNPGSYIFAVGIDKVKQYQGQTTCTWEQSVMLPHTTPAYYYVNRAP